MSTTYQPAPPPGYRYQGHLFADLYERYERGWMLLIWANLLALIPLGVAIIMLWLPYQLYRLQGTPWALFPDPPWTTAVSIIVAISMIVASIILHEALHLGALHLLGHQPVLRIKYFTASIRQGEYLSRRHYLIMSLTPVIAMTLLGGITLLLLPPAVGQLLLIALLLNAAASIGDLVIALRVKRAPAAAVFADDRGIRVFLPESEHDDNSAERV